MTPLAQLDARVSALERAVSAGSPEVDGWRAAARLLKKSAPTVRRLAKTDPRFPQPARILHFTRRGSKKAFLRPTWQTADLLRYGGAM